jgi:hypothetical protein
MAGRGSPSKLRMWSVVRNRFLAVGPEARHFRDSYLRFLSSPIDAALLEAQLTTVNDGLKDETCSLSVRTVCRDDFICFFYGPRNGFRIDTGLVHVDA